MKPSSRQKANIRKRLRAREASTYDKVVRQYIDGMFGTDPIDDLERRLDAGSLFTYVPEYDTVQ